MRVRRTFDLDLVSRIDRETFPFDDPVLPLAPEGARWWTAGDVAFAGAYYRPDEEYGVLLRCGVRADARGQGLQKRLIRARLRWLRSEGASCAITYTVTENAASMRSLIACGFRPYRPAEAWAGESVVYWIRKI